MHRRGWALVVRGGTPSVPPWILPAHALNTALAYASRVAFSWAGRTYSPGRSSPSSTVAPAASWLPREPGVLGCFCGRCVQHVGAWLRLGPVIRPQQRIYFSSVANDVLVAVGDALPVGAVGRPDVK
eukprot:5774837-Prymnesium_polylepis.1